MSRSRGGGGAHLRTGGGPAPSLSAARGARAADASPRPLCAEGKPRDRTWPLHLTSASASEHGTSRDEFMEKPFFNATS